MYKSKPLKLCPATERTVSKPTTKSVTKYKIINERIAVAIKPL